jgi:hypothetical protein
VMKVPVESTGIGKKEYERLKTLGLNDSDLVIWDFDCTLSKVHMYKTMNMHMSMSWRDKWGPEFSKWWDRSKFDLNEIEEEEKEEG